MTTTLKTCFKCFKENVMSDLDMRELLVFMFNQGYEWGHDDTVDGSYAGIVPGDIEYHADLVDEILKDHGHDALLDELERVTGERDALQARLAVHEQIAKEFIAKVESGRARSKQTYDAMKAALKESSDE